MPTTRRTPSERDRRTFSAVLCIWVLVSERGLEPPRGYTPHQVLSLARLPIPPLRRVTKSWAIVSLFSAQNEGQGERADTEQHANDHGEPVEIPLYHGRTCEARSGHPAPEDVGKSAALTGVKQYKGDQPERKDYMHHDGNCCEDGHICSILTVENPPTGGDKTLPASRGFALTGLLRDLIRCGLGRLGISEIAARNWA